MHLSPSCPTSILPRLALLSAVTASLLVTGCATRTIPYPDMKAWQVKGTVHGGQQPIAGALVQLYAAGTNGRGTGATALLSSPPSTDAGGAFSISSLYTCAQPTDQVYLVVTGGDPGGGINSNITLISALGDCAALTSSTFISINEVTTVAAAYALANYMTPGSTQVGTVSSDLAGLATAFQNVNSLVDPATGTALPGSGNVAQRQITINTLADSIAACVDTNGGPGACSALFTAATPALGSAPSDTLSAAANIVANPQHSPADIYNLAGPTGPFQPTLSAAPTDWTLP